MARDKQGRFLPGPDGDRHKLTYADRVKGFQNMVNSVIDHLISRKVYNRLKRKMRQAIRIVIMVGNLFVCSLAISANWYTVYEYDDATVYIETRRVNRQGDKINYWERWVFKKPRKDFMGKLYISRTLYKTVDCKEGMTGITQIIAYDTQGNIVYSYHYPLRMEPVVPDSIGEVTLDNICAFKKENKQ